MITNVLEYLQESVKKFPDKIALVDDSKSITFRELDSSARAVATAIKATVGKEIVNNPIVVYMEKSVDVIVSFLGILYSGNFYCPIDIKMPQERRDRILSTLNPICAVAKNNYIGKWNGNFVAYEEALNHEIDDSLCGSYKQLLDVDPIYTLFTSGSTGVPKGVTISHRGVIDYTEWLKDKFDFDESTIFGNQAPFYFDNSILDIYSTLKNGSTMVIIPESVFMLSNKLIDYVNEKDINTIFWVPSALVGVADSGILEEKRFEKLEKILFCGEVMPCKQLNVWKYHYPKALYANLYGPTEITDVCTYYIVDREFADDDILPIGKGCENAQILIINEENKLCKPGENGELCVRGCGVSMGYYANWEKTESAFVQNPLNNNYRDVIYRTGDIVYLNDNNEIIYVGRKDFQIKHQGHRIELGEIEAALGDMSDVKQGCAVYDDVNKKIVMFVVADSDEVAAKGIYAHLKQKLPKYMLPKDIVIIDEFPLNLNGKIDRLELKKRIN